MDIYVKVVEWLDVHPIGDKKKKNWKFPQGFCKSYYTKIEMLFTIIYGHGSWLITYINVY